MEIALSDILGAIHLMGFRGDNRRVVSEMVALDHGPIHDNALFWCSDKFCEKLRGIEKGNIIVSEKTFDWAKAELDDIDGKNWIVVKNPRATFSTILSSFFYEGDRFGTVAESARIHPSVKYNPETVNIGENVVIEEGVTLGDQVKIGHNSVVMEKCKLGDRVKIGSNSTIGGVGFGYEKDENGNFKLIPHIGNVVLEDDVHIGNNVAVDRAVLGSTLLGRNVKVDNLVHISHGVQVGENSLIIANAMIAGSCDIGKNVWVSPSVSVIQKTKIGDNSLIGLGSVVIKEVEESTVVAGVPSRKIKDK